MTDDLRILETASFRVTFDDDRPPLRMRLNADEQSVLVMSYDNKPEWSGRRLASIGA